MNFEPLKDCNLIEAECKKQGYCSGHTGPQSSKPDTTSELPIVGEIEAILKAYDKGKLTTGHATQDIAALIESEVLRGRIDELEHTLPFGKNSNLYQNRVKELRATLDGVRGEQQV